MLAMIKTSFNELGKINGTPLEVKIREKSVGTTELHYSTKKRKHSFSILKAFFVRHSSSDVSYTDECRTKKAFSMLKECFRFFVL